MDLHTYLKYNGIQLIDPTNDYHASCIKQFRQNGYLSYKQLACLKKTTYSKASDIIRLLAMPINQPIPSAVTTQSVSTPYDLTPFDADFIPQQSAPEPKRKTFSAEDLKAIVDTIKSKGSLEDLANGLGRSKATIASTVISFGGVTRKGQVVAYDKNKLDAVYAKRNIGGK